MTGSKTIRKIAAILGIEETDVSEIINYAKPEKTILDTGRIKIEDMHDVFTELGNLKIYELNWFEILSSTRKYA